VSRVVVAASRDWFWARARSDAYRQLDVVELRSREALSLDALEEIAPRYVFFPHWNWRVEPAIFERFECVVFHTAPLPYGRGGSPVQNMILQGFETAPVCALRMTADIDGGPIYDRREISLAGTVREIFARIGDAVEDLIVTICRDAPEPVPQSGEPVHFRRRTPAESELPAEATLREIYDRIRMVDGEGYPKAFIRLGDKRIEFSEAQFDGTTIQASVSIKRDP
jgi:methionyl-tRNA formyltransferase